MQQRRPSAGDLPRGSFVLEVTFGPPPASAVQPPANDEPGTADAANRPGSRGDSADSAHIAELFGVFVPDEDGLRIAWGAEERFLISLLAERPRAKASATLAGRPGLGDLHQHRVLAGGFISLAGLDELRIASLAGLHPGSNGFTRAIERAPHRGQSPIVYALSQPSDAWLHLTARLGRDSLVDLLFSIGTAPGER
jgi:hypothetical protein